MTPCFPHSVWLWTPAGLHLGEPGSCGEPRLSHWNSFLQVPAQKQQLEKHVGVIQEGDSLTNIRVGAQGAGIWQNFLWRQTLVGAFLFVCFPSGSAGKASACNTGDLGSIPGLGRSPGEGNSYPLKYSGLENFMDYIVHGIQRVRQNWATFTLLHFHLADLSLAGTVSVTPNPPTKHHVPCLGISGGLNLPTLTGLFKVAPNPRHLAPLQSSPNQCWWPSKAAPTLRAQPNPTSAGTSALLKQLSLQGASPVYLCAQRPCSSLLWGQFHKSMYQ